MTPQTPPPKRISYSQSSLYIGQKLKFIREKRGLTQKQIAEAIGVSFQQVQKYEMGLNRLPIEKLYALVQFYDVPFEFFFHDRGDDKESIFDFSKMDHLYSQIINMDDNIIKHRIYEVMKVLIQH